MRKRSMFSCVGKEIRDFLLGKQICSQFDLSFLGERVTAAPRVVDEEKRSTKKKIVKLTF